MTEQKKKLEKLSGVKGMNDILPHDAALWELFETTVKSMLRAYGYQKIRTPIVEHTQLFTRGIGEVTDIVEKEMYTFTDSLNGEHLTLAPGKHGGGGARGDRTQPAVRRPEAPVVHRPDVPPRASAARPLSPVSSGRRGSARLCRSGCRRRNHHDVPAPVGRPRPDRHPARTQFARQRRRTRGASRRN